MNMLIYTVVACLSLFGLSSRAEEAPPAQAPKTHSFITFGHETALHSFKPGGPAEGEVTWSTKLNTREGWVLANGNILLTVNKSQPGFPGGGALEMTRDGKTVWEYKGTQAEVNSTQKTPEGSYVLTEAGPKPRLLELDAAGRIMEWNEDFEETEIHHRHSSPLWGLFPGSEIHPGTPELFTGAKLFLERRGDASTGWSMAWKANFWARLGDGDHAAKMLGMLIGRGAPNLFCLHPPFQIDGNFGGCSAVAEMLLQSQADELVLLPALPGTWQDGQVRGLHARGGFVLDLTWKAGQLTEVKVTSQCGSPCQLRCGDKTLDLELKKGESRTLKGLE